MTRPVKPHDLYTVVSTPVLHEPVLIVHLDGWIDASGCARAAIDTVLEQITPQPVAIFDTEWLIDHRSRRPTMRVVEGINVGLDWPRITLLAGCDGAGHELLVLRGAEPDHNWRSFVAAVVELAQRFNVRRMIGLGAFPVPVPHSRPTRLSVTATNPELVSLGSSPATLDVPAGIESALERAFKAVSIDAVGVWAQVPHYLSGAPYPAATLALIESLSPAGDLRFDTDNLATESQTTRRQLDDLVTNEDSHREMLAQLEQHYDLRDEGDQLLPTLDELAEEVEQFLREQQDPPSE